MSHGNEIFLYYDKMLLFNKVTFPICLEVCGSRNFNKHVDEFTSPELKYEKSMCSFNCFTKFDLATSYCESIVKNHPYNQKINKKFLDNYEKDLKLTKNIEKLF